MENFVITAPGVRKLLASLDGSKSTVHDELPPRVGLKSDGTTGQTTGHLAARGSASRYMARRKAMRQATELTMV